MSERPGNEADQPDERPDGTPPGGEPGDASGDNWSAAVDRPDAPQDATPPAGGPPRMGFSGSTSGPSDAARRGEPSDEPDLEAILQQMMGALGGLGGLGGTAGGAGGAGGSGQVPDLGALMRQLGASGQLPDLDELMKQLGAGGAGGRGGMPDLGKLLEQLGASMPGAEGGGSGSGTPMGAFAVLQQQLAQMFSPQTAESRAAMATDVARKTVAAGQDDPTVTAAQQREVTEAVQVAQLWVDPVTSFDAPGGRALAWSRAEWVEATMPTWSSLVAPVSAGVTRAVTGALKDQMGKLTDGLPAEGLPEMPEGIDLAGLLDQVAPAMEQLAGTMFAAQLGQGVGALAADLLTGTEVGLPLLDGEDIALLPVNVAAFTEGLSVEPSQVRLYLAVREAARARLFAAVPWLGPQLEAAVRDYAANITIDTDAIEEQVRGLDLQPGPEAMQQMQEALQHKLFAPTPTPQQQAALTRLETSLALVEGWVDIVTEQATTPHLPQAAALGEAMRRRRAGGPAQKTFSGFVGLELRPRRLKDARNLWAALEDAGGKEFRDAPWAHPDIAPRAEDLDDPLGYVEKRRGGATTGDDFDTALDALLRGEEGPAGGTPPVPPTGPPA